MYYHAWLMVFSIYPKIKPCLHGLIYGLIAYFSDLKPPMGSSRSAHIFKTIHLSK